MFSSDYAAELLAFHPTGYYKLDEDRCTTLFDFSGNVDNGIPRHLAISGAPTLHVPTLCSDWPNGAMKFNSGSDYCSKAFTLPSPFTGNGALTIIGLLKPDTISQIGTIIRSGSSDPNCNWAILQQNGSLRYAYYNGSSLATNDSAGGLVANTRTHFAFTRAANGTSIKFYINGVLTTSATAGAAPNPSAEPSELLIGGIGSGTYFPGVLDELAIYVDVEMPDWRIAQLYARAIRIWPNTLPQVFDQPQYEEGAIDITNRFPVIYGPPKTRPYLSKGYTGVRGIIQITDDDKDTLETFYTDTLKGGAITFEAQLRGEPSSVIYKFMNPIAFHDLEGGEFEASMDLIALP